MKKYSEMTREELQAEKDRLQARYDKYMKQGLNLNMARGKPSIEQEEASIEMLDIINSRSNLETEEKQDVLNYGNLMGRDACFPRSSAFRSRRSSSAATRAST